MTVSDFQFFMAPTPIDTTNIDPCTFCEILPVPFSDDDEDYTEGYASTKRRPKRSRNTRKYENNYQQAVDRIEEQESESSESDGDWDGDDDGGKKTGRGRRGKRTKKRQRIVASDDSDGARVGRLNSRTGQTVNYAEMEASDSDIFDSDDAATQRARKEAAEDADVDRVEYVCDFRPIKTESEEKKLHSLVDFHSSTVEFYIKWTGKSYRRNTWHTLDDLKPLKGFKKVTNYVKICVEQQEHLNADSTSAEEREESLCLLDEHRKHYANFEIVERIVAERAMADDASRSEYLVKWKNLDYDECTWEPATELSSGDDLKAVDAFSEREQAAESDSSKKRLNCFNVKDERPRFQRMREQPSYLQGEGRTLREYQLGGLNFLAYSWSKRNNVILADEMGLGKTLQTISFLGWLMYERQVPGPFLVVVPLSTSAAWVREFQRWVPDMNVVRYCGNAAARETIRRHEFWPSSGKGVHPKFHVLLTTPELLMLDEKYIDDIRWNMIAVDEAHRLKNEKGALHITLKSFRSANRLLVTGTPLQNSVHELWALLNFLNPKTFPDAAAFEENFSFTALRDPENVSMLHNTLRPFIIRRQKIDVEKSLPKKSYAVLRVGMSSSQQEYYKLLHTKNFIGLNAAGKGKKTGGVLTLRNLVMELKKCCNHPFLFPQFFSPEADNNVQAYIRGSGKMILLDKLLVRLREKGHRVLIFSQMVSMLDILQDYCRMRAFPHQRLDGTMHNDARQRAIDHYNEEGSSDYIFLLSTRAGGLGINLATADTVIIFDSDWNPQNDLQAESRAHRIGQKKDVKVFRLLTKQSVEEQILERAKRKRVLEHLVIHGVEGDGKKDDGSKVTFKKEELSAILRFGAESLFEKGADGQQPDAQANGVPTSAVDDVKAEERRVLAVDDIDELLARTPVNDADELGAAEQSVGDSLLNAFKWADFDAGEEEDQIEGDSAPDAEKLAKKAAGEIGDLEDKKARDIEKAKQLDAEERELLGQEGDSAFWNRVIPDEMKIPQEQIVVGRRRRKPTNTYGADTGDERKRRRTARSRNARYDSGELSVKEQRALLKSFKRFGDPKRTLDILKDSGLESRIEVEDAKALLEEALEKAKSAVEEADAAGVTVPNGVANGKKKESSIVCDVLGDSNCDGFELVKRCAELQSLRRLIERFDEDTQFRLQKPPKRPAYGVRWMPQQDALLLVGVIRHGFGNWGKIAADPDLHLSDKMTIAGRENNKAGAPDGIKLTRRVYALFRVLENEQRPVVKKRSKSSSKKKSSSSRDRRSSGKGSSSKKRRRDDDDDGGRDRKSSKTKKKGSSSKSTNADFEKQKTTLITALRATHSSTVAELKELSTLDSKMGKGEKISRTKQCLLKLGRTIEKQASTGKMRIALWTYVHEECSTNLPGDRLSAIYDKLKSA